MFDVLRKSLKTGVVTTRYPAAPPEISARARGRPEIDWANWKDARPSAGICPTGAISYEDANGRRTARLDDVLPDKWGGLLRHAARLRFRRQP